MKQMLPIQDCCTPSSHYMIIRLEVCPGLGSRQTWVTGKGRGVVGLRVRVFSARDFKLITENKMKIMTYLYFSYEFDFDLNFFL